VHYKTYKLCIVATAENDYDKTQFKMTFEIYCDLTNKIVVDPSFITKTTSPAGTKPEDSYYVFDPMNLITTSFVGCPIISFEISPSSNDVKIM